MACSCTARRLHRLLTEHRADSTLTFRALADNLRGNSLPFDSLVPPDASANWLERWRTVVMSDGQDLSSIADGMDRANPAYIPRNHLVDTALNAATEGDLDAFERLLEVVTSPFDRRDDRSDYALLAPENFSAGFKTYCGP